MITCYPHGKASLPGNLLPGNSDKPPTRMTQWLVLTSSTENKSTLSSSIAVVRKLWSQSHRGYRIQTSSFLSSRRSYRPRKDSLMEITFVLKDVDTQSPSFVQNTITIDHHTLSSYCSPAVIDECFSFLGSEYWQGQRDCLPHTSAENVKGWGFL